MSDARLQLALDAVREIVPPGSKVEIRAFDKTWIELSYANPNGEAKFAVDDPDVLPILFTPSAAIVWISGSLEDVDLRAQQIAKALHQLLEARATGVFDGRLHKDPLDEGVHAPVHTLAIVTRRPDMDRDEFIQYYRTVHVPLAKRTCGPTLLTYTTFRLLERFGDLPGDACMLSEYSTSLEVMKKDLMDQLQGEDEEDAREFVHYFVEYFGQRMLSCTT